jgi:HTH-type transcriptional regulator/antitoxin HigA
MTIRPIRNSNDHESALKRIQALMSAKAGTDDGDELDVLATLVDAYETKHFPIDSPDPIEAIRFRMEQLGLERKDLEPYSSKPPYMRIMYIMLNKRYTQIEASTLLAKNALIGT